MILAFDTATEYTAVAVYSPGHDHPEILHGVGEDGRPRHAAALLPAVELAVDESGGWSAIDRIAVGTGPGTYTGLRVGLATARALAMSGDCELVGVCTLDALAAGAFEARPEAEQVLAVIDARRSQVFAALYGRLTDSPGDGSGPSPPASHGSVRLMRPVVCEPDRLSALLPVPAQAGGEGQPTLPAVGSGALRFPDQLTDQGLAVPGPADPSHTVSARQTALLGAALAPAAGPPDPIYLRAPDAQRWRDRDSKDRPK